MFMVMALPRPAERDKGGGDGDAAERDLGGQQDIAKRPAASGGGLASAALRWRHRDGFQYLPQRHYPEPYAGEHRDRNAVRISDDCGITMWNLKGYSVGGCQIARPVSAIHAQAAGALPRGSKSQRPRPEPGGQYASGSIQWPCVWRSRGCGPRFAPRTELPRLAQAASSTIPARPITPARNARVGPLIKSPTRPGRVSLRVSFSSSFGYSRLRGQQSQ